MYLNERILQHSSSNPISARITPSNISQILRTCHPLSFQFFAHLQPFMLRLIPWNYERRGISINYTLTLWIKWETSHLTSLSHAITGPTGPKTNTESVNSRMGFIKNHPTRKYSVPPTGSPTDVKQFFKKAGYHTVK